MLVRGSRHPKLIGSHFLQPGAVFSVKLFSVSFGVPQATNPEVNTININGSSPGNL